MQGANVSARDNDGLTALMFAAKSNETPAVVLSAQMRTLLRRAPF